MKKFLSLLFCLFFLTANSFASTRAIQIELLLDGVINPTTSERVASGTAYFYSAGTTDAKSVWTEKEKTNAYTSYSLNGGVGVQLYGEGNYKIVIKDSNGATVRTFDNIRLEYPNYYIRTITAGTTAMLSEDDFILCNTTGGAITINALAAASWTRPLKIQRISGSSNITFDPNGSETIDGSATLTISSDAIVEIISDGSNLRSAGFRSSFADADNDTKIQVEESADEDKVRIDVGGDEKLLISPDATESYIQVNALADEDNDTKIQVEESADEDTIRFDIAGSQVASIDADGITADEVDAIELKVGGTKINATPTEINAICDQSALNLQWSSSSSSLPILYLRNTNEDASSVYLRGVKDSISPADEDHLLIIQGQGNDDAAGGNIYTEIDFFSSDVSDGDEAGAIKLSALVDGTKRNLLELNGYNGSVNQGEIILNEDGQDVDFRIEASGAANAFKVQGSDGAVSISETLDIGSSTTKRVAPAGTFASNSNGNPNVSDTGFSVTANITENTWESVGPTGSGADNIWTALDNVPIDADWIEISGYISGTDGAATSELSSHLNGRKNGGSENAAPDNRCGAIGDHSDASGNAYTLSDFTKKIPVNSCIFDLLYQSTFTTDIIIIYLSGWGFNP